MEPPCDVWMKMCSNVPGHMTKVPSRPIYCKNLLKSPSEPSGRWPWNLEYSIGYSSTTKYVQMMTLGWPWAFLWDGQICFLMPLQGWTLYSIWPCISKLVLIQHILCTQVCDTGPMVLWGFFLGGGVCFFDSRAFSPGNRSFICRDWLVHDNCSLPTTPGHSYHPSLWRKLCFWKEKSSFSFKTFVTCFESSYQCVAQLLVSSGSLKFGHQKKCCNRHKIWMRWLL